MSALNSRDQILSRKPKTIQVTLPDGEQSVTVRRWSAMDWERHKASGADDNNLGLQLAMVLCDDQGKRLFDPDKPEDCVECAAGFRLDESGVTLTAAGRLIVPKEQAEKKSEASPNTASASA